MHSLPSNLVALPVVGLLVMPWALLGFLLIPFGLDAFAWRVMGFGIEIMLTISRWIAGWPMATISVPAFPTSALLLLALGLCWLGLWTTRLRFLGALPVLAGLVMAAAPARPDIYVEPGGRAAAVRGPDGRLHLIGVRFASFAAETWLAADGDARGVREKSVTEGVRCDSDGCTAPLPDGRWLALTWTYAGLREDCAQAAIIVTRLIAPPGCRKTAHVIDGTDLAARGAVTMMLRKDGGFDVETARRTGERIWHGKQHPPDGPAFAKAQPAPQKPVRSGFDPTDAEDEVAPEADDAER